MTLDLNAAIQIGIVLFSAGAAWGSVKLIGAKVDSLKESVKETLADHGERIAVVEARSEVNATKIAVVESRVGSMERLKAVIWPRKGDS